jgi:hypothetical protein
MTKALMVWRAFGVVVGALALGCASTPVQRDNEPPIGSSSDLITAAELSRFTSGLTLIEVIEHARPWFLQSRGSNASVSVDGSPPTDSRILRTVPVSTVNEIRLVRGGATAIRSNGTIAAGDVILVVTRKN